MPATLFNMPDQGYTAHHIAAWTGTLHRLPKKELTLENLTAKSKSGYTPLRFAAENKYLNQIPTEILLEENLIPGTTILHWAAKYGYLSQLPKEIFTRKALRSEDRNGETPFHMAAWTGHLKQFPRELLTPENLLYKGSAIPAPLQLITTHIDDLLGIDFCGNQEVREMVGEDWWHKNIQVIKAMEELSKPYRKVEIELF